MNLLPLSRDDGSSAETIHFRAGMASICADPELHTRFLNTLSLLEHIGSRKIMLARASAADSRVLKHLAEETRHAWFFKRAAEKLARRALDYGPESTLAGTAARFYMGRLDARITAHLRSNHQFLAYLYMSLIVEDRAIWAYRMYQEILGEQKSGISLSGILGEEKHHLDAMIAEIEPLDVRAPDRMNAFCVIEHAEFARLWRAIERDRTENRAAAE
jgi:hypothetical protein